MTYSPNPDNHSWQRSRDTLTDHLRRWGAAEWSIDCQTTRYATAFFLESERATRRVSVWIRFPNKDRPPLTVHVDRWSRPIDNLWALAKGIGEIRLNELRGLGDVARQVYLALEAPAAKRDPWEVLGVRPDAPIEVAEASYRALAKGAHPDTAGGDAKRMTELNDAIEAVRKGRAS